MVKTMDKNRELAELMGTDKTDKTPAFDTDLNAMAEVEKVIAKKSNRHKYAEMVRNRTGSYYEEHLTGTRFTSAWGCMTAPARVRRDIALIVLKEAAKLLKGET
jgi:hypothetical protein